MSAPLNALQRLAAFDASLFLRLNRLHDHFRLEGVMRKISFTGDGYLYVLLGILLPLMHGETGLYFLATGLFAFLLELPVYWVLKNSFRRRRPCHVVRALAPLLDPSDEFSFPSGHTTAAFMMAMITSTWFPALGGVMLVWASLVGLSRIMLRVHFLSDVLAGVVLGSVFASLAVACISPLLNQ